MSSIALFLPDVDFSGVGGLNGPIIGSDAEAVLFFHTSHCVLEGPQLLWRYLHHSRIDVFIDLIMLM